MNCKLDPGTQDYFDALAYKRLKLKAMAEVYVRRCHLCKKLFVERHGSLGIHIVCLVCVERYYLRPNLWTREH